MFEKIVIDNKLNSKGYLKNIWKVAKNKFIAPS